MRSKAQFQSHPLHPMLIPFPIAFLVGAFLFNLAGVATGTEAWWTVGAYLAIAGVVMGVVAAVPGFIDYLYSVPPNSTGKRRATKHMLVNLGAVALFALAWLLRGHPSVSPDPVLLGMEALGVALLTMGGWMGGTLVYRNQIGVDHRYAGAGKWDEERVPGRPGQPVKVAAADELEVDQMKLLWVDGRRIVLGRTEEGYVAFDDHCTHRGGSLAGGVMLCGTVHCPWHGSHFDVRTGEVRAGPAEEAISTYRVEEEGGEVRLIL